MALKPALPAAAALAAILACACVSPGSPESAPPGSAHAAAADASKGARIYADCAGCHGATAQGTANGQVPALAGQHYSVIVKQLLDYREGERWDARMESVMAEHRFDDDAQIANVAAYIAGMRMPPAGGGSGIGGEHGATVYAQHCASCHGPRGEGNGEKVTPRLAGQQYMYLRRQLHDAVDGRRPNMPADHVALLAPLDVDDIDGLAEYLAELAI
ncbi:MAG: hypothetical protein AMXMBFR37_28620 [Steroidobacteraceae bacterium]